MGGHDDFQQRPFATRQRTFKVALQQRGEGLLVFPFRVSRGERFHPVEGEKELEVHGLLGPERAVIVENGNPLGRGDEIRTAVSGHPGNKFDHRFFHRAVVPGRQGIALRHNCRREQDNETRHK